VVLVTLTGGTTHHMTQSYSLILSILAGTFVVAVLLAIFVYFNLQLPLLRFFDWLQTIGVWAGMLFILIDMLLVICLLPSILFTLAAGFLFGAFWGGVYVVIATTLGAASAFLISRHIFSEGVKSYLRHHKKLKVVNDEFVDEGWKFILLTRLVPFFPLKLSNYVFGASNFRLTDFVKGTCLGIIPNTFFIVYLGSLAADLSMLASGDLIRSEHAWGFYAFAVIFLLVTVTYITKHAQKALLRFEARSVKKKGQNHAL
jgi:uncharacterized membrane protein YdjX (TVP38/TMEM64 family)